MKKSLVFALLLFVVAASPARADGPRPEVLQAALAAQKMHAHNLVKTSILAIIDYSLPSNAPRLFIVDPRTGETEKFLVAHGRGSDPDFTGLATRFSNRAQSLMSSLGAFATGGTYSGAHGLSLKLVGLEPSNDRAEERAIVLHGADYVEPGRRVLGRSWGCPAVEQRFVKHIIDRLKGGALLYIAQ